MLNVLNRGDKSTSTLGILDLLRAIPEEQLWLQAQQSPNARVAYRSDILQAWGSAQPVPRDPPASHSTVDRARHRLLPRPGEGHPPRPRPDKHFRACGIGRSCRWASEAAARRSSASSAGFARGHRL
jgi:hypothetical protein